MDMGKFDDTLTVYTTNKGIILANNLIPSIFRNLKIKTPAYLGTNIIPKSDIRDKICVALLDNISLGTFDFKATQLLKSFHGGTWLYTYYDLLNSGKIAKFDPNVIQSLQGKAMRSQSGVVVNTISLSPFPYGKANGDGDSGLNAFSCKFDCSFCPNQPGVPRSYLSMEPAVMRGIAHQFHPVSQTFSRLSTLFFMGHPIDKIEIRFLGGTWNSYSLMYRKWIIWQTYRAHNNFYNHDFVLDLSEFDPKLYVHQELDRLIADEQSINQSSDCRIIGLTIETRPDCINRQELIWLRQFGCTRVEMGIQHTNDDVLRINNRGHLVRHSKYAIKLLKDHGFKIVIHLMPQLPGSNPAMDRDMLLEVIRDENLQADEWKLYNCEVVPYTKIEKWYKDGTYVPYSEPKLMDVYRATLPHVPEYVRIDRLKRDIPSGYNIAGIKQGDYRNRVFDDLDGACFEIRNREIKGGTITSWQLSHITYKSSGATEYFIMVKNQDNMLCGFCRLRLPNKTQTLQIKTLEQLRLDGGVALIRELHVYGKMSPVNTHSSNSQHRGFGQMLVKAAEKIAQSHNYQHMAIIAGVGTRLYYQNKLGYSLVNTYMVKRLSYSKSYYFNVAKSSKYTKPLAITVAILIGYWMYRRNS